MVRAVLAPTVRSLLVDVLDPHGDGLDSGCLEAATVGMVGRIEAMPRYLGLGMTALTIVFELTGPGHSQRDPQERVERVARWRTSRVGPCRDFVEFYEKMGTFVYFTQVEHRR